MVDELTGDNIINIFKDFDKNIDIFLVWDYCAHKDILQIRRKEGKKKENLFSYVEGPLYQLSFILSQPPLIPFNPPRNLIFKILDSKEIRKTMPPLGTNTLTSMAESGSAQKKTPYSSPVNVTLGG